MSDNELSATVAIVTGASRGFGRAIAAALGGAGAQVVGIARDRERLRETQAQLGDWFAPVAGDATDPMLTGRLVDEYRPGIIVLNAGAAPLPRPLHQHSWETFSRPWETDVRQAFLWSREILLAPLAPGSTVVAVSSLAAIGGGSPLSGGYAGAKAMVRFMASYAGQESDRAGLGIRFLSLLPNLTPATEMGKAAVAAYAKRQGVDVERFTKERGEPLTPQQVGAAVLELVLGSGGNGSAFSVDSDGMKPLS